MQFQRLQFENREGKRLAARLDLPADEKPLAYAIFAHCFTCTKNLNAVVNINRAVAREGIAVLRFDFTGLGESEGDFGDTGFSSNVEDLVDAAQFLASHYESPKLLIGHSLGGAAVLNAAMQIPSVQAVATIGAPASLSHLSYALGEWREKIREEGQADVALGGRTFTLKRKFLEDLGEDHMKRAMAGLAIPLIIFHSPADEVVDFSNALELFEAAPQPKSLISIDGADHLLSEKSTSLYVGSVLAAWAKRYVSSREAAAVPRELPDNRVIARIGKSGYQTEIIANGHRLMADEPIAAGGANTGPTPYDLLGAALAACTAMTLRMYADRKSWPLEAAIIGVKHQKVHATDCETCEESGRKIDSFSRDIELSGPLDDEQRRRLLEIADRCPVHRTLHSEVRVVSRLTD